MPERILAFDRSQVEAATAKLDKLLLDENGQIKLLPYEFYAQLSRFEVRAWAWSRARYGIPTVELVDWLNTQIAGRSALEIGAGNGDLGHHLNIQMTDAYAQQTPQVKAQMAQMGGGQPVTAPPPAVKNFDAADAIRRFRPQVAIASWVTQVWRTEDGPDETSTPHGVDEEALISRVETYIHIGHEAIHRSKRALQLPHQVVQFNLVSRREDWERNVIYVWSR